MNVCVSKYQQNIDWDNDGIFILQFFGDLSETSRWERRYFRDFTQDLIWLAENLLEWLSLHKFYGHGGFYATWIYTCTWFCCAWLCCDDIISCLWLNVFYSYMFYSRAQLKVQYDNSLPTALQRLKGNINHILNSQKTPHISPSLASYGVSIAMVLYMYHTDPYRAWRIRPYR